MNRVFRVRINRELILANLSREDGRHWSDAELEQWLLDAGFRRVDDQWVVAEENLGHLDPSEVIAAEPLEGNAQ